MKRLLFYLLFIIAMAIIGNLTAIGLLEVLK